MAFKKIGKKWIEKQVFWRIDYNYRPSNISMNTLSPEPFVREANPLLLTHSYVFSIRSYYCYIELARYELKVSYLWQAVEFLTYKIV